MEEYSRPASLEDLKALIRSLNEQDVDYLLIGGYALFAHGYHRATTTLPAGISRESLYRALSPKGNPTLRVLLAVLKAVGMRLGAVFAP